jgi:hypothetical protein
MEKIAILLLTLIATDDYKGHYSLREDTGIFKGLGSFRWFGKSIPS